MFASVSLEASRVRPMTTAEWLLLPQDEPGELVEGWLVEEEIPDLIHEVIVATLIRILGNWIAPARGIVAGSDLKLSLDRGGRKPDLCVFFPGGSVPPRRGPVRVPPDIVVEVVSPTPRDGRRDRVEKFDEYAQFGVRFYWLVDPALLSVEIFELREGHYTRVLGQTSGRVEAVPGCDGLALDIDALWAEVDALGPEETSVP